MLTRYLACLLLVASCRATPAELAAAQCNPAHDLEECSDDYARRLQCNPANGQWTPIELCVAPQQCVSSAQNADGQQTTTCTIPGTQDDVVVGPADGAVFIEVVSTGTEPNGSSGTDADANVDADAASGTDLDATAAGPLEHQACFQTHCALQAQFCLESTTCVDAINSALDCIVACGGGQSCLVPCENTFSTDSVAFSLATCGLLICSGGCGDGECEPNESPQTCPADCKVPTVGSCAGNCGGASSDCFCDSICMTHNDCCLDFAAVCGG